MKFNPPQTLSSIAELIGASYEGEPDFPILGINEIAPITMAAAGNSINVRVWLDGDVATKLAVDLTSASSSKLEAWSAQVIVRFTPRDMTAPADSLDITSLVLPLLGA